MVDKPAFPVLITGCGDIGRRVARLWLERGATVYGLARTARSDPPGLIPLEGDLDHPETLANLPGEGTLIYYFAPPPGQGPDDPRLTAFLKALRGARPLRLVYISTSAVYGDRQGAWVDEQSPPAPGTERGRRRLAAETAIQEWSRHTAVTTVILRVGGIYGPGRLPLDGVRARAPMLRAELAGWTNRIHAEDLARVCVAAGERGCGIYNVSDGQPGSIPELYQAIAASLGLPRPPELDWEAAQAVLSPGLLSYLSESRRLDTGRMQRELGVRLLYPDLASGLAACPELGMGDEG